MLSLFLFIVSLLSGIVVLFLRQEQTMRRFVVAASSLTALLSVGVALPRLFAEPLIFAQGTFYLDPFAAMLMLLVGGIQWTAMLVSGPYVREELHEGKIQMREARLYYALALFFVFTMFLTLACNNIGLMWVALEGTTLATTILVAFYTYEGSLEAAWKYILICSVGISLGLLGVLLVFYAALQSGQFTHLPVLTWTSLHSVAASLPPSLMRLAFIFIFIGYGAKVGLVPMHTWLPDAHGRTPSPISGMLSGLLLNVALFAILRYKSLVDGSLGDAAWTNQFFLVFGALSFALPAAFILIQRNYKRLLAYSSIEHMGFATFSLGLGVPGMVACMIHLIGHSLAKSMLFFATGNILLRYKSTKFEHVQAVMTRLPYTGCLFVLGLLALLAIPPSPLFLSEYMGLSRAFLTHPWAAGILLLFGAIIFAGFILHMMPMLFAKAEMEPQDNAEKERWNSSHSAMLLHLIAVVILGILFLQPGARVFFERMVAYLV